MMENADRIYERLLVLRCQAGDEEAFAKLVERYQPRLRYYLRKMLFGVREPDDVLQDVWLDVFRSIARLADADAFRAWLYSVARARALKVLRKQRPSFQEMDDWSRPKWARTWRPLPPKRWQASTQRWMSCQPRSEKCSSCATSKT
jgi:RNA polymerase sigma-70 factor (ECF subfamily)